MIFDVVILAGGLGTRLASVISDVPKPMAPVAGKPFLDHILCKLPLDHIGRIILAVGHKYQRIEEYYGAAYNGTSIEYSIEKEPLGTGGGIGLAMHKVQAETALILNGDTFFDVNLEEMWQKHSNLAKVITLALKQMENPDRYGTVLLEGNTIVRFQEKIEGLPTGLINGGVYWVNKNILDALPNKEKYSFESEFLELAVRDNKLSGYISEGLFIDIGIPSDYERAQEIFA
ncbi:nucleotidyltransferase family protein [Bacteroidia bacterium]|nr:nucleotidyltransferase family protein [Bacteroidia bacterium]MDC1395579.1 nucleotidyltransferase family protein [Bacteroidia bacterium]